MTSRAGPCSSEQTGVFISWSSIKYLLSTWQSLASRLEYYRECGSYLHSDRDMGKAIHRYLRQSMNDKPKTIRKWARHRLQHRQEINVCHRPPAMFKMACCGPLFLLEVWHRRVLIIKGAITNTGLTPEQGWRKQQKPGHVPFICHLAHGPRVVTPGHPNFLRILWPRTSSHLSSDQTN
jgi:hypothetical protein